MKLEKYISFLVCAVLIASLQVIAGPTYSFVCVSNNSAANAAIGESQLSVEILNMGGGQVEFLFINSGSDPASLTDIYFDDSGLGILSAPMGFADIVGTVSFSQYAKPGDLPGGSSFSTTTGLSADSDSPVSSNGVNTGEQLGVTLFGKYGSIVDQFDNGGLRIGLHVQAMGTDGESEWFISNGPVIVPAPGAILLAGLGITLVGVLRNRKNALQV